MAIRWSARPSALETIRLFGRTRTLYPDGAPERGVGSHLPSGLSDWAARTPIKASLAKLRLSWVERRAAHAQGGVEAAETFWDSPANGPESLHAVLLLAVGLHTGELSWDTEKAFIEQALGEAFSQPLTDEYVEDLVKISQSTRNVVSVPELQGRIVDHFAEALTHIDGPLSEPQLRAVLHDLFPRTSAHSIGLARKVVASAGVDDTGNGVNPQLLVDALARLAPLREDLSGELKANLEARMALAPDSPEGCAVLGALINGWEDEYGTTEKRIKHQKSVFETSADPSTFELGLRASLFLPSASPRVKAAEFLFEHGVAEDRHLFTLFKWARDALGTLVEDLGPLGLSNSRWIARFLDEAMAGPSKGRGARENFEGALTLSELGLRDERVLGVILKFRSVAPEFRSLENRKQAQLHKWAKKPHDGQRIANALRGEGYSSVAKPLRDLVPEWRVRVKQDERREASRLLNVLLEKGRSMPEANRGLERLDEILEGRLGELLDGHELNATERDQFVHALTRLEEERPGLLRELQDFTPPFGKSDWEWRNMY
jgi:hypothetical protein